MLASAHCEVTCISVGTNKITDKNDAQPFQSCRVKIIDKILSLNSYTVIEEMLSLAKASG